MIKHSKAIIYVSIANLSYALSGLFVQQVSPYVSSNIILFFRFFIGFIWILTLVLNDKSICKLKNIKLHLLRGVSGLLAIACFFYSLRYLSLVNAMLLNNIAPLFIPIILYLLNEKITFKVIASIFVGFIGVLVVLHPNKDIFQWAALIAIFSSFFAAVASISIKTLSQNNSSKTILLSYFFISSIGSGATIPFHHVFNINSSLILIALLLVGILGVIFQIFITKAFMTAPTELVSPMLYLSIIFGAILGYFFDGQNISNQTILGFLLIITGCSLTVFLKTKTKGEYHAKKD